MTTAPYLANCRPITTLPAEILLLYALEKKFKLHIEHKFTDAQIGPCMSLGHEAGVTLLGIGVKGHFSSAYVYTSELLLFFGGCPLSVHL